VKKTKSKKDLTNTKIDAEIREFLKHLAETVIPTRSKTKSDVSKALGLSSSAVEQMRIYGHGSIVSWLKLVMYKYNLSTDQVQKFFEDYKAIVTNANPVQEVDKLYQEAKNHFSDEDLFVWLRLLLAKQQIEDDLRKRKK